MREYCEQSQISGKHRYHRNEIEERARSFRRLRRLPKPGLPTPRSSLCCSRGRREPLRKAIQDRYITEGDIVNKADRGNHNYHNPRFARIDQTPGINESIWKQGVNHKTDQPSKTALRISSVRKPPAKLLNPDLRERISVRRRAAATGVNRCP